MLKKREKISILVIEDESIVALEIKNFTASKGYDVIGIVDNYDDALEIIKNRHVNILLCDIYLKGAKNGIDIARSIKQDKNLPKIIYLTAFSDEKTISSAIDTEPCGYLTKPFKREELDAMLQLATKQLYTYNLGGGYTYSIKTEQLSCKHNPIPLSKKEHDLLQLLIAQNGKPLTKEHMEHIIWPNNSISNSARRTLIYRLNQKLNYQIIKTIPGSGYQLSVFCK